MSSWYLYIQDESKLSQMGEIEYPHDGLNVPLSTLKNPLDSLYSRNTNDTYCQASLLPNNGIRLDILLSSLRLQSYPTIFVSAQGGVFCYLLPLFNPFYFNRFSTFIACQCFININVPTHIHVLCFFKNYLMIYFMIEIVCFSDKLALVFIGT